MCHLFSNHSKYINHWVSYHRPNLGRYTTDVFDPLKANYSSSFYNTILVLLCAQGSKGQSATSCNYVLLNGERIDLISWCIPKMPPLVLDWHKSTFKQTHHHTSLFYTLESHLQARNLLDVTSAAQHSAQWNWHWIHEMDKTQIAVIMGPRDFPTDLGCGVQWFSSNQDNRFFDPIDMPGRHRCCGCDLMIPPRVMPKRLEWPGAAN